VLTGQVSSHSLKYIEISILTNDENSNKITIER